MNRLDFSSLKVLVIGDVMIDHYIYGHVNRISPEAPVPILHKSNFEYRLGGAANVALNLHALGATPILMGVVGEDYLVEIMQDLLCENGILKSYLLTDKNRKTTLKSRVISNGQQLLRIDNEDTFDLKRELAEDIVLTVKDYISTLDIDGIVLQDYNKGILTPYLIRSIIELANVKEVPVIVDPKFDNFHCYADATIVKPNKIELEKALGIVVDPEDPFLFSYMQKLRVKMNIECLLVTLSQNGIAYVTKNEQKKIAALPRNIIDVCGAGDSVLSIITCAHLARMNYSEIGLLANIVGGLSCEIPGVSKIHPDSIRNELSDLTRGRKARQNSNLSPEF